MSKSPADDPQPTHSELDARGTRDLVGHVLIEAEGMPSFEPGRSIVLPAKTETGRWIDITSNMFGPSRGHFRSIYFQWAMAINGLHLAKSRYSDPEWKRNNQFTIDGFRGGQFVRLALWDGDTAARAHIETVPKLASWGYIELYSALEHFVFNLYQVYLNAHPDRIMQGDDFKALRKLRRQALADPAFKADWEAAWSQRLAQWRRKRLYDSLDKVFLAYFKGAGLKTPPGYKKSNVDTWAETISGLALVRHLLVHGEETVPKELEDFCAKPHALDFNFIAGSPLRISFLHLQVFETFIDQLITAINLAFLLHPDARK